MILSIITFVLVALSFWNGIRFFLDDPQLVKQIYFSRLKDYLWAFLMFLGTFTTLIFLSTVEMPSFLTFSWVKLLGGSGTNLIVNPGLTNGSFFSFIFSVLFYMCLIFILPYLAKIEELSFRSMKFKLKSRIWNSIKFGFVHMIVGVPVYAAILLCFIGYIFSIKYVMTFKKNFEINDQRFTICDEDAINAATSLHAKFNFIIISLVLITLIILQFTK